MGTYAQTLLDVLATSAARLRREARGHSHHRMTSSFSPVCEEVEKRAPARVVNAFGEMVMAHHPPDVQLLHADAAGALCVRLSCLKVEVAPLPGSVQVLLGHLTFGFLAAMTALLAALTEALCPAQPLLPSSVMARVRHHCALRVRQKHVQAHVQPASGLLAHWLGRRRFPERLLGHRLTDDQRIPVPVCTQHKMRRGR